MIESVNIVKKIAKSITANDGGNIIVLFDNINPISDIASSSILSVNGFLKNLKGYGKITSLTEAPLPDIRIEDSEPERRMKALDVEWKSERKQLDLLVSADGNNWIEIGSISLIKQQGYPYRMYSLLDFYTDGLADEFGSNGKAGCRIVDVGYGLLESTDLVTIHGSYLQEIVFKTETQPVNINLSCGGTNTGGGTNTDGGTNTGGGTNTDGGTNTGGGTNTDGGTNTNDEVTSMTINQSYETMLYGGESPVAINENTNRKYLSIKNIGSGTFCKVFFGAPGGSDFNEIINLQPGEKMEITKGGLFYTGRLTLVGESEVQIVEAI